MIYNLDLQPAALVVHIGFLPTLLWFSFRAEPGDPRRAAKKARDAGTPDNPNEPEDPVHSRNREGPGTAENLETPEQPGGSNGGERAAETPGGRGTF